jgi:hemerythrin superfamily protein
MPRNPARIIEERITMATENFTDAIALLKADHRKVEELFEKFEGASGSAAKRKLAEQICNELKVHATIEEEIFYPAMRGQVDDDVMDEAYVEHDGAKVLINDILSSDPDAEFYDAKVTVLSEDIKHHVKEEEQAGGMFAQAKKAGVDLKALGEQMMARKMELMPKAKSNSLPEAQLTALKIAA